jgi:predicted metal-dependent peptidase
MDLKTVVKDCIATLILQAPMIGLFLKRTWIYESREVQSPAWTDGISIYINPDLFSEYSTSHMPYILAHEAMHILLKHNIRAGSLYGDGEQELFKAAMNIAADVKVNQYLDEEYSILKPEKRVNAHAISELLKIDEELICKTSFEELSKMIYEKLLKNVCPAHPEWNDLGNAPAEALEKKTLNEGDEKDREISSLSELERSIDRKASEIATTLKTIGRLPGWAERLLNEILPPSVDWRSVLRKKLTSGMGIKVRKTWARPNKKLPSLLPGKDTHGLTNVLVLVDTSGSIDDRTLKQFLGEIYGILKENASVVVIPWDATAYEPVVLKRAGDIEKVKTKMVGGGGTAIWPALELADRFKKDQIVILSDWMISDKDAEQVMEWFRKNARIITPVTTLFPPPAVLGEPIKLNVRRAP